MTNYAYAPAATLQTISSAAVVAGLIERDHGFPASISGTTVRNQATGQTAPVQDFDTYPQQIVRVGAIDSWVELQSTVQDGIQGNGSWQTTENYGDMPYADAKRIARADLGQYVQSYRKSFFTAAGNTFSADDAHTTIYNTINTFIDRLLRANPAPVLDFWIFDTADVEHHITTIQEWDGLVNKWDNLWADAQTHALTAWTDVRNATTTDEIRTIMAGLAPIPTDPNAETP